MARLDPRFARQARLPEVGEAGQARIAAYTAEIESGYVGDVAALYLARAGAAVERNNTASQFGFSGDAPLHPEARAFFEGASLALRHLRAALGTV